MKKVYFSIFEYISTVFLCIFIEIFMITVFKGPSSAKDWFVYIFFGLGWIPIILNRTYYYDSEIVDTLSIFLGIKRVRTFSQIALITKVTERIKTIRIIFLPNKKKEYYYSGCTFIKYAFQKKQLIEMLEKIVAENPNEKFLKKDSIISKDEFIKQL